MDYATYASAQNTARQIYDHKLAREGGPRFARVKELDRRAQGQVSNNYLHFENIRQAALGSPAEIDRDELLRIWSALPEDQRLRITTASMRGFFRAVSGVKLDIAELRTRAQQELCALHAGVGSAPGTGAGAGGVHQPGSGEDCRVPEHGDEMAADEWDASNSSNDPARIEHPCPAGCNAGCAEGRNPPPPPLPPPAAARPARSPPPIRRRRRRCLRRSSSMLMATLRRRHRNPPIMRMPHAHAGHGDYAPVSGGSCLGADPESLDSPAEAASERGVSGGGWPA
jgi:hypothetical protein